VVAKTYQSYSTGRLENVWGRTQRFQLRIKAYKNIVVKTLKFLVKCTDTFLFWQKMPVLENRKKVVQHQARKYGETKFGMERFINGFLDLITIWFLSIWKKTNFIWCNGIANVHHWFY
jgi:hypothetical protein